uniref:Uncharacterized protein n=1 Tax=Manihot esculenta TaxID=3983 RepID=A0A2C9UQH3_MANES
MGFQLMLLSVVKRDNKEVFSLYRPMIVYRWRIKYQNVKNEGNATVSAEFGVRFK